MLDLPSLIQNLVITIRNALSPVFSILMVFLNPIVAVATGLTSIVAWLLGALADPQGAMNSIVNKTIDVIAAFLPSTPESLKLGFLLDSVAASMPAVGRGVISEIFVTISAMFGLVAIIKLYKLIPFKAT